MMWHSLLEGSRGGQACTRSVVKMIKKTSKILKFSIIFVHFLLKENIQWTWTWIRIRIVLKCWIRIRIKTMRIRNTVGRYKENRSYIKKINHNINILSFPHFLTETTLLQDFSRGRGDLLELPFTPNPREGFAYGSTIAGIGGGAPSRAGRPLRFRPPGGGMAAGTIAGNPGGGPANVSYMGGSWLCGLNAGVAGLANVGGLTPP